MNLYSLQSIPNRTPAFVISCWCTRSNRGMRVWVKTEDVLAMASSPYLLCKCSYMLLNFETILMDGKNEQYHNPPTSKVVLFSNQFKSSNWPPLFVPNLKTWYLSKTISFLNMSFHTYISAYYSQEGAIKKMETFSLQGPIHLGVFCLSTF